MEPFLSHLETVQRAAQLAADSNESAEDAVHEAYRRALAAKRGGDTRSPRRLLLAELRKVQESRPDGESATLAERTVAENRASAALETVKSVLHQALAGLDTYDWSLLFLSEIDSLTEDELAELLGDSPDTVAERMQVLHSEIHQHLFADASPAERVSLLESLPDDWLEVALSDISSGFPGPSEGLRSRIAASAGPLNPAEQPRSSVERRTPPSEAVGPKRKKASFRPLSILVGIALILAVGFGADYLHSMLSGEPENDLVVLVTRNVERYRPDLRTTSVERGERFLRTHSGLRPGIPEITEATLEGVGMEELAPGVNAPAARYLDKESGSPITVYAVSYSFLDRNPSISLSPDVRRQIQGESNFDLHSLSSGDVLIWRSGPGIYLAVSRLDGRALQDRILPAQDQE